MIVAEMSLQRIVVEVVLWILSARASIAQVASFMLIAAVSVQFIITIESFAAESTLRMALESALIDCTRVVIAILFVALQLGVREQLMLVGEHLLVPRAQIAHHLLMYAAHMSM
jgi:hypothetical protein